MVIELNFQESFLLSIIVKIQKNSKFIEFIQWITLPKNGKTEFSLIQISDQFKESKYRLET